MHGWINKYKSNKNTMLRDKLNSKIEILRNTSRQFIKMFKRNCMLLEEVRI